MSRRKGETARQRLARLMEDPEEQARFAREEGKDLVRKMQETHDRIERRVAKIARPYIEATLRKEKRQG